MSITEAPNEVVEFLISNDVEFTNSSTIDLLKISSDVRSSEYSTILCVTTNNNNEIKKDYLIPVKITDDEINVEFEKYFMQLMYQTRDGLGMDIDVTNGIILHATAVADGYNTFPVLFRPHSVMFTYRNNTGIKVDNITVIYDCHGFPYTYPGLQLIEYNEWSHSIVLSKDNPAVSTRYANTKQMQSNVALDPTGGPQTTGHFLGYKLRIGNKTYENNYTIALNPVYD